MGSSFFHLPSAIQALSPRGFTGNKIDLCPSLLLVPNSFSTAAHIRSLRRDDASCSAHTYGGGPGPCMGGARRDFDETFVAVEDSSFGKEQEAGDKHEKEGHDDGESEDDHRFYSPEVIFLDSRLELISCFIKRNVARLFPIQAHWLGNSFGFSKDEKPWIVPWTFFTILQVMFLWFITFWFVGSWIIPALAHYLGCSKVTLTFRGQALYSLVTDIAEGTVGLGILYRCLAQFHPLPRNWFPINWRGQWYTDVLFGCLMFPLVNRLSEINLDLLPLPPPVISSCEQSFLKRDPVASLLYAVIVSVCCPIWEEVIFRGFLLPSLTRYLPMWVSIIVSAVVFGLAHFSMQRMLPLTFLGLMMGILFVRTRNLLPSMLLHSLWNAFVFVGMFR